MTSRKPTHHKIELKETLHLSDKITTATGSAISTLQDVKQGYENLSSTFDVSQQQVSGQINIPQKIDGVAHQLKSIEDDVKSIKDHVKTIEKQTRAPTFWQKVKEAVFSGIIGWIIAFILGILVILLGLHIFGHPLF